MDELIEQMAGAIALTEIGTPWRLIREPARDRFRTDARAALDALKAAGYAVVAAADIGEALNGSGTVRMGEARSRLLAGATRPEAAS